MGNRRNGGERKKSFCWKKAIGVAKKGEVGKKNTPLDESWEKTHLHNGDVPGKTCGYLPSKGR